MNIVIVDRHPLYIMGLQSVLFELDPSLQTMGAQTLQDAIRLVRSNRSRLMLLSLDLPGISERDALIDVQQQVGPVAIVAVSSSCNPNSICSAIERGAAGCLHKDSDPATFMLTIRRVLDNQVHVPLEAALQGEPSTPAAVPQLPVPIGNKLTERQHSVLLGLLQGKSNKAIAHALKIADGTVKAHLSAVYRALGVTSRLQAMSKARGFQLSMRRD